MFSEMIARIRSSKSCAKESLGTFDVSNATTASVARSKESIGGYCFSRVWIISAWSERSAFSAAACTRAFRSPGMRMPYGDICFCLESVMSTICRKSILTAIPTNSRCIQIVDRKEADDQATPTIRATDAKGSSRMGESHSERARTLDEQFCRASDPKPERIRTRCHPKVKAAGATTPTAFNFQTHQLRKVQP